MRAAIASTPAKATAGVRRRTAGEATGTAWPDIYPETPPPRRGRKLPEWGRRCNRCVRVEASVPNLKSVGLQIQRGTLAKQGLSGLLTGQSHMREEPSPAGGRGQGEGGSNSRKARRGGGD